MYQESQLLSLEKKINIKNQLKTVEEENLRQEIIDGLQASQKCIPSKFFYDKIGSALFEMITELPEYYPTRAEKQILKDTLKPIFSKLKDVDIIELGSGDCSKISLVLQAIPSLFLSSINYHPVDFSASAIAKSAKKLNKRFPELNIKGLVADFTSEFHLEETNRKRIFCFFGSTLGNFSLNEANKLLSKIETKMQAGDELYLGLDMIKPVSILEPAYNDSQRITEAFNKNILRVCNTLIQTNFTPINYEHLAYYNEDKERIEMHLRAKKKQTIDSPYFNETITLLEGETIHTENSHKYSTTRIQHLASNNGLKLLDLFYDNNQWFCVAHLRK